MIRKLKGQQSQSKVKFQKNQEDFIENPRETEVDSNYPKSTPKLPKNDEIFRINLKPTG